MSSSKETQPFYVDREQVTPSLIRIFLRRGHHLSVKEYRDIDIVNAMKQIHMHTWLDATLLELCKRLSGIIPMLDEPNIICRVSFAILYPDRRGQMVLQKIGIVEKPGTKAIQSSKKSKKTKFGFLIDENASKTLKELKFEIGDYLDIAIIVDERKRNRNEINDDFNEKSSYFDRNSGRNYQRFNGNEINVSFSYEQNSMGNRNSRFRGRGGRRFDGYSNSYQKTFRTGRGRGRGRGIRGGSWRGRSRGRGRGRSRGRGYRR